MPQGTIRILYVDDDPDDHLIVQDLLEEAEVSVELEVVSTYEAALDRLLNGDHDVCLLDYKLNGHTGLDVLRELATHDICVPVIILTGRGNRSLDLQAAELGAVDYLVKEQLDAQVLERTIRYAVKTAHGTKVLRESEERYVLTAQGANDGLWDWNLQTNNIIFSPRWKSIFGYAESEINNTPDEWFGRVHPEDLDQVEAAVRDHVLGKSDHLESTHRIRHADGSYRWVLVRAAAARTRDGEAYRMAGSHMDITKLRDTEQQLLERSFFDQLTGLPSRNLLLDRAAVATLDVNPENGQRCAMLAIRVDAASSVGLTLGKTEADRFITETADRFRQCMRNADTIARLGDDEFGVLLTDIGDITSAVRVAERLRDVMSQPLAVSDGEVTTTITVGIADTTEPMSGDDLLSRASAALAQADAAGGERIQTFDEQLHARSVASMQLESNLRRAITEGTLSIFYQPIASLRTGQITSFEALVRWQHPERGLLLPDDFIPLAEETNMIRALDRFVLETACKQLVEWHKSIPDADSLAIGVNYSSKHFVDPQTAPSIAATLASVGLDGKHLHLELTESALLEDPDIAIGILTELSDHDIDIVLDDFGTGFSSLSYLQRLPVFALKIDRSFVKALTTSTSNADIVRSIIGLAGNLGFGVIAEGVESHQQLQHLMEMGCDEAQGFLLGHPVDAGTASALLEEQAASKDGIWVGLGKDAPAMASTRGRPIVDVVGTHSGRAKSRPIGTVM